MMLMFVETLSNNVGRYVGFFAAASVEVRGLLPFG